jgi:FlaA1/EpsC-like NDP-sugar epimerase
MTNLSENFFSKNTIYTQFGERFLSKWVILLMDMVIVMGSFTLAHLLRYTFNYEIVDFRIYHFVYIFSIRLVVHLYFQTYTGIIRHTSMEDIVIIFKTIFVGTVIAKLLEYFIIRVFLPINQFHIFSQILIIDFFASLYLLIGSRFFVKFIYEKFSKKSQTETSVLIYGAGSAGSAVKLALQNDKNATYKILGFIDDNPSMVNKKKEGIFVYSADQAIQKQLVNSNTEIILAINDIPQKRKKEIAERFLNYGVILKTVSSMSQLLSSHFNSESLSSVKIEDLLERPTINLNISKIQKELSSKVVLVTGAAGSIGSEIVRQLIKFAPEKIILVDQAESMLFDFDFELKSNYTDYLRQTSIENLVANVCDKQRMNEIFKKHQPQFVFHAAAYKHVPLMENNPYEAVRVNVLGSKLIADLSLQYKVSKFVMVSTDKAVNPTNVMGATKRLAEMYTQSLNGIGDTKYIITRFGNVLGSNGSVIPLFTKQILAGGPVTVTHPEITRYFMTIPEASQLVMEAGAMGEGSEVFVFDMGKPVKVLELARKMIQLSGYEPNKDIKIQFTGLRPGEKLYEELLNDNENCVPTHHPKIMRAKINAHSYTEMELALTEIETVFENGQTHELVQTLKYWIPEFLSKNSIFEKLDVKK